MSLERRQSSSNSYASFFDSPIWLSPTPPPLSLSEFASIDTSASTSAGATAPRPQYNHLRSSSSTFFHRPRIGSGVISTAGEKGLAVLTRRRSLNLPRNNSFRFGRDKSPAPSAMVEALRSRLSLVSTSDNQAPAKATQEGTKVTPPPMLQTTAPRAVPVKPSTEVEDRKVVQDLMDNWGGFGDFALGMPAFQTESLDSGNVLAGLEVAMKQVQELEKVEEENETEPDGGSLRASKPEKRVSMFHDVAQYIDGELRRITVNNTMPVLNSGSSSRSSDTRLSRASASSYSHTSCEESVTSEGQEVPSPSVPSKTPLVAATTIATSPSTIVAVATAVNASSPVASPPATITPSAISPKPAPAPTSNSTFDIKSLSTKKSKRPNTVGGYEHSHKRRFSVDPMRRVSFTELNLRDVLESKAEGSKTPVPVESLGNPKLKAFFSKIQAYTMVWRGKKAKARKV